MSDLFGMGGEQGGGIFSMLLMFGAMFAIMYFILIRPQQKQQKRHQELVAALKKGDEVILSSGIVGRIFSVEDKFVTIEIADKVKMKVLKAAVQGLTSTNAPIAAVENAK
jgi:preprotein translocase subunit YajC